MERLGDNGDVLLESERPEEPKMINGKFYRPWIRVAEMYFTFLGGSLRSACNTNGDDGNCYEDQESADSLADQLAPTSPEHDIEKDPEEHDGSEIDDAIGQVPAANNGANELATGDGDGGCAHGPNNAPTTRNAKGHGGDDSNHGRNRDKRHQVR